MLMRMAMASAITDSPVLKPDPVNTALLTKMAMASVIIRELPAAQEMEQVQMRRENVDETDVNM